MNNSSSDQHEIIGGIIGVPNHDREKGIDGCSHNIGDDSTCISALSWGGSLRPQHEPIDQRQPHRRTSQGTERRLHPFPWSTPDDSDIVPDKHHSVEQTGFSFESTDAAAATNDTGRPLRRSSLVANESSLDASWFALRGVMSTDSFKRYKQELKQNVIREASSNNLQGMASSAINNSLHRRSRRASTGMGDLHNEQFQFEGAPSSPRGNSSSHEKRTSLRGQPKTMHRVQKSLSLDDGLDKLVQSFISSFRDGDEQRNRTSAHLIQSKLSKSDGQIIEIEGASGLKSGLSSEELQVLTNMMRRLSNSESDRYSEQQELYNDEILNADTCDSANRIVSTDMLLRSNDDYNLGVILKSDASTAKTHDKAHLQNFDPVSFSSDAFESLKQSQAELHSRAVDTEPNLERDETTSTLWTCKSSLSTSSTKGHLAKAMDSETASSFQTTSMERKEALDNRNLQMPILCREHSRTFSMRTESKSSPVQSRTSSDVTVVERSDSISTKFSGNRNPTIHMPPLNRFQSNSTAGAVVCEADDFISTMKDFDDEVQQQKMSSNLSGSTMSQTRCTSPNSLSSKIEFSSKTSSSALLNAAMADLDGPPLKQDCGDLLVEGIEHLSMAMLVNIYGKLREMSLLGHVSVKLRDIDVNSHQYNSRKKEIKRLGEWTAADEAKGYLDTTRNAGFIVRAVMDEHELFEAEHARGANSEINHALLAYDASLLKDFKTWVEESRVKQLDTATEGIIKRIREECSQRQMAREEMMSSNHSLPTSGKSNTSLRIARRRGSLLDVSQSFQGASWMKQERKLIEDHFGIKNGLPASRRKSSSRDRVPGELSGSLISKAIEESSDAFFEEGSVMRNLLESGFEVVWFADRHPSDIIYGICVNRQTATVTVVFRGQDGIFDLCCNTAMSSFQNPIAHEDYEGNSECINLRSVVADGLLRVRMDTKMSLISEIREKVVIIGQELANGTNAGYHLSVVGHSRGGGYATVLGYYLASDMYLEVASAVRVFTFASSPVGCADFQKGFKHLEEEGRLVHARFANSNDLFTSLPLRGYSEENKSKVKYHHVGMQVRLHKANEAGRRRIKQSLDVSYDAKEPLLMEMARAARNVLSLIKALICFVYTKNYCISQYHLRMHFAREYRLALGDGALRFDRKRKCLKSLNEYYVMKCRRVHNYTGFKEKPALLPTWAVIMLVTSILYVQIDIFLKFAGW